MTQRRRTSLALWSLGIALLMSVAVAFDPQLSDDEVEAARQEGAQLASTRQSGYQLQDWVLYDVEDPFTISEGQGEVEAVTVGTPFERLRYRSYLENYQGNDFTSEDAQQVAEQLANTVTFVVYAHAPSAGVEQQDFLEEFGEATLQLSGGEQLTPSSVETFGPAQDFYSVEGGATEFRWLGTVSYRFDLSGLSNRAGGIGDLSGTLVFADSTGREYSFDVDLSNYR